MDRFVFPNHRCANLCPLPSTSVFYNFRTFQAPDRRKEEGRRRRRERFIKDLKRHARLAVA